MVRLKSDLSLSHKYYTTTLLLLLIYVYTPPVYQTDGRQRVVETTLPKIEGESNILIDRLPDNGLAPRIFTLMCDMSIALPDGIRFGYEWGGRTIAFNTIGDPALIFERQEAGNTRYSYNK